MRLSSIRIANYKSIEDSGDLALGSINILIGRNNSGKSSIIQAVNAMQQGSVLNSTDIRIGCDQCTITSNVTDLSPRLRERFRIPTSQKPTEARATVTLRTNSRHFELKVQNGQAMGGNNPVISGIEPANFIYTYLSKRKVTSFDQVVNRHKALTVSANLENIVSKVDRLANPDYPKAREYEDLCRSVLGFRVSSLPSLGGHQAGIPVGNDNYIAIEAMGEGVSSLLGLITDLCVAEGNLFLIEELENDIHPEGLKKILAAIADKSSTNQFIISTHSNIVTKYLGSIDDAKVFDVALTYNPGSVPVSVIREVPPDPKERISILRQLGYELYDFNLWDGWLILEESTAEVIIRDYLIPWFAPRLSRVRTVSAGGTSKMQPVFDDFNRLFLFTYLQPQYQNRAWVVADGDPSGKRVIESLIQSYKSWPAEHFRSWRQTDFEYYYPKRFEAQVTDVLSKKGDAKRDAKRELIEEVKRWCGEDNEQAKALFESSAAEVISFLRECEEALFGLANTEEAGR